MLYITHYTTVSQDLLITWITVKLQLDHRLPIRLGHFRVVHRIPDIIER